jgi:hypothetical protein
MGASRRTLALAGFLALSLSACSSNNDSYSYNLDDNGCVTNHSFSSKDDYCSALTKRSYNQGCALESRKQMYSSDCSGDFRETDIPAFRKSGYDDRLGRECSVGASEPDTFGTLEAYCDFLKSEDENQGCFWADRKEEFESEGCPGGFSADPTPIPTPTVTATPAPTVTPTPTPSVDTRPQVARDLEAAGIQVEVMPEQPGVILPGEQPYQDALDQYWNTLALIRDDLIARRDSISKIVLSDSGFYEDSDKTLFLCVRINEAETREYLSLLDSRVALTRRLGMSLDLESEVQDYLADPLADLRTKMNFFEASEHALTPLRGTVKTIKLTSYSNYFLSDRSLSLDDKNYATDIAKFAAYLDGLSGFFTWCDELGLKISGDMEVSDPTTGNSLRAMVSVADSHRDAILDLRRLAKLDSVDFSKYRDKVYFSQYGGAFSFAVADPGLSLNAPVLEAMQFQFKTAQLLGYAVTPPSDLDKIYLQDIARLRKYLDVIRSKKAVTAINLTGSTSDFLSFGLLDIGYAESDADFEKILASIPN